MPSVNLSVIASSEELRMVVENSHFILTCNMHQVLRIAPSKGVIGRCFKKKGYSKRGFQEWGGGGGGGGWHSFELFIHLYLKRPQFGLFKKTSVILSDGFAG